MQGWLLLGKTYFKLDMNWVKNYQNLFLMVTHMFF